MKVILKYQDKNNNQFRSNKKMTIQEANRYFNKYLKNDDEVVKSWLTLVTRTNKIYKTLKNIKRR